jgi:hypothetical protein
MSARRASSHSVYRPQTRLSGAATVNRFVTIEWLAAMTVRNVAKRTRHRTRSMQAPETRI